MRAPERRQRPAVAEQYNGGGPPRGDACHSRSAVVTLKHMLRISNDAERRRELFSATPNRGRSGRGLRLDYALGRRM